MIETSSGGHPLPAERAFVVQLYAGADVARGRIAGRVEHVVSGQAGHFDTLEGLLTFIERVLASLPAEPPEESGSEGAHL
jgi:hypothetical protein